MNLNEISCTIINTGPLPIVAGDRKHFCTTQTVIQTSTCTTVITGPFSPFTLSPATLTNFLSSQFTYCYVLKAKISKCRNDTITDKNMSGEIQREMLMRSVCYKGGLIRVEWDIFWGSVMGHKRL